MSPLRLPISPPGRWKERHFKEELFVCKDVFEGKCRYFDNIFNLFDKKMNLVVMKEPFSGVALDGDAPLIDRKQSCACLLRFTFR